MPNLIEELRWRGMIQDIMPGTEEQLNKEITTAYIGFDPTADSLHIGSLVPIILLVHLQKAGHKPIALVGGATGMVGDPSGKSEERNLLSEDILNHNVACVKKQLEQFLNFDKNIVVFCISNFLIIRRKNRFLNVFSNQNKFFGCNVICVKSTTKRTSINTIEISS